MYISWFINHFDDSSSIFDPSDPPYKHVFTYLRGLPAYPEVSEQVFVILPQADPVTEVRCAIIQRRLHKPLLNLVWVEIWLCTEGEIVFN